MPKIDGLTRFERQGLLAARVVTGVQATGKGLVLGMAMRSRMASSAMPLLREIHSAQRANFEAACKTRHDHVLAALRAELVSLTSD